MASKNPSKAKTQGPVDPAFNNTDSGPATAPAAQGGSAAMQRAAAVAATVQAMPHNPSKAQEYGDEGARCPYRGAAVPAPDASVGASTLSESQQNAKTGEAAEAGVNAVDGPLARVRADAQGQALTTNQGVPVSDNQHSLKAGLRGPAPVSYTHLTLPTNREV